MIKMIAVIIVSGRAFLRNFLNPLDKFLLFKSLLKETVCLKEWITQKYKVKAISGDNKQNNKFIDIKSKTMKS